MKKFLTLATVFVLAMTLSVATAQEQPKKASKEKSGCCSHEAKSGCEPKATKKTASKHDCKEDCKDECTHAEKTSSTEKKESKKS
jgi:hypothetical protein